MNEEMNEKVVEELPFYLDEITFYRDIKPLFKNDDRNCMKKLFDLYKYNDVCNNAEGIYNVLKSGEMPPGRKWSTTNVEKFKKWIDDGKIEGIPPEREAFYRVLFLEAFKNLDTFISFIIHTKLLLHYSC